MATVAITVTAAQGNAGTTFRALALAIQKAAGPIPDVLNSGASTVLTISDAPATGAASVVVSGQGLATQPTYVVG